MDDTVKEVTTDTKSLEIQLANTRKQTKLLEAQIAKLNAPRSGDVGYDKWTGLWFIVVIYEKMVIQLYQPNSNGSSSSISSGMPLGNPDVKKIKDMIVYNTLDRHRIHQGPVEENKKSADKTTD